MAKRGPTSFVIERGRSEKVARLVQAGKITVDYLAKDKKNIKTEKYYHVQAKKYLPQTSQSCQKRLELRDYLLKHPEEGKLSDLHHLFHVMLSNFCG